MSRFGRHFQDFKLLYLTSRMRNAVNAELTGVSASLSRSQGARWRRSRIVREGIPSRRTVEVLRHGLPEYRADSHLHSSCLSATFSAFTLAPSRRTLARTHAPTSSSADVRRAHSAIARKQYRHARIAVAQNGDDRHSNRSYTSHQLRPRRPM